MRRSRFQHRSRVFLLLPCQNENFTFVNFEKTDNLIFCDDAVRYTASVFFNTVGTSTNRNTCGKLLFKERVRLLHHDPSSNITAVASFNTAFTFSMQGQPSLYPDRCEGHGFAFLFTPDNVSQGDSGGTLCTIRNANDGVPSNHMFAVEFDTHMNDQPPYFDPSNNHVGVNINSMKSVKSKNLCGEGVTNCSYLINKSMHFTAWIEYNSKNRSLEIRLANGSSIFEKSPPVLMSVPELDLANVFLEYMYVGFSSAVSRCTQVNRLGSWSFSSSGMPEAASPAPPPTPCSPCRSRHMTVMIGVFAASVSFLVTFLVAAFGWYFFSRKLRNEGETNFEQSWFFPRKFTFKELVAATNNFSDDHFLGIGGFGEVYKGTVCKSHLVAVKRLKHASKQGEREFSAEISIISHIRHRNLVQILGWCRENDQLLLVYEYMPNSSLDVWLFDDDKAAKLTWNMRCNILRGLAAALAFLHEDSEHCIVHRDIKASNVMLDIEFNAHLGDFGLARLVDHDRMPMSTTLAGTIGYLAPELPHTRKATKQSDVYSYGVLALETACGRPVYDDRACAEEKVLHDIVWEAHECDNLLSVADSRLLNLFDVLEITLVLRLGLLCCLSEPGARPSMRFIHQCIMGEALLPHLPISRPDQPYNYVEPHPRDGDGDGISY